jgi:hypothetical protein
MITEESRRKLVIQAGDAAFARLLFAASALCVAVAAGLYLLHPHAATTERLQGLAASAGVFLVAALGLFERATFVFDGDARTLSWQRRRAFTTSGGTLAFDAIRDVASKTFGPGGEARVNPRRRVVLVLAQEELPLTVAYAPDPSGAFRALATQIRRFLDTHRSR